MIDYAAAATCSSAYGRAWATFDGDAWVALFTDDAEYHEDPFGAPLVGHNALRAYLLDAAASQTRGRVHGRAALGLGHDGPRRLARAFVRQRRSARVARIAGFLTAEVASDGRISRFREWTTARARRRRGRDRRIDGRRRSFDVVSDFDEQELRNALDQVRREVGTRFDFKGVTVDLSQAKDELILVTDDEHRAAAVKDLIESKAIRRSLSLKIFDWGKVEPAGGNKVRQRIGLRRGLPEESPRRSPS